MSREDVLLAFGPPGVETKTGNGATLFYSTGPMGQVTYAAHLGADGRVRSVEQVLRDENFAQIRVGEWDRQTLRDRFGLPAEVRSYSDGRIWWSYRYKESDVWEVLMNVLFYPQGIVRQVIKTPDPMYEKNAPWP